ncbi:MAG: EamA family transporter, partial [Chitinophagaceae bacterium]
HVAFSYALYLILQKKNAGFDPILTLSFHFLVALLILMPFAGNHVTEAHSSLFYILITIIAIFFTIMPLWLNLFALKGLDSATVGMLINVNPIIAFTLAILHFREKTSVTEIAGYSVVFVSVIVFNFRALRIAATSK